MAVMIAQAVSLALQVRANLPHAPPSAVIPDPLLEPGAGGWITYIDDMNWVATVAAGLKKVIDKIASELKRPGLPPEPTKWLMAGAIYVGEALGLWWWKDRVLTFKASSVYKLITETERVLCRGFITLKHLQRLVSG